ncbi:hypothetical protein ACGGZK_17960 [Agromyces sp. MMS24-K17]|uniref:hypothetical protein n=1 Tax=Agromyces sp. MMS24-K17 TaxID=3372850 RepID=UPI0037544817
MAARRERPPRDDRLLPATRILAAVVIPFLAAAAFLLLLLPGTTATTFAWTIRPPLSAMLLGSAYLGGIWFFSWTVLETRWHRVHPGFPAVVVFAGLLGIATLLHADRFHPWHVSFVTWSVLYAVTPFAVLAVLLVNRLRDPRTPEPDDAEVPRVWATWLAVAGGLAAVAGLALFLSPVPSALSEAWGWSLTPLTAKVLGAVLTLPGVVNLQLLRDRRWSSFRWTFQAQLASLAAMLVSVAARAGDLEWTRPAAWAFAALIAGSAVAYAVFYAGMERRRRVLARAARDPAAGAA